MLTKIIMIIMDLLNCHQRVKAVKCKLPLNVWQQLRLYINAVEVSIK